MFYIIRYIGLVMRIIGKVIVALFVLIIAVFGFIGTLLWKFDVKAARARYLTTLSIYILDSAKISYDIAKNANLITWIVDMKHRYTLRDGASLYDLSDSYDDDAYHDWDE
jgi:hypothetical protein